MQLLDLQRQLTNANCEFLIGYYKHALKYVVFRIWSKCLFPLVVCIMFMLCVLHVGFGSKLNVTQCVCIMLVTDGTKLLTRLRLRRFFFVTNDCLYRFHWQVRFTVAVDGRATSTLSCMCGFCSVFIYYCIEHLLNEGIVHGPVCTRPNLTSETPAVCAPMCSHESVTYCRCTRTSARHPTSALAFGIHNTLHRWSLTPWTCTNQQAMGWHWYYKCVTVIDPLSISGTAHSWALYVVITASPLHARLLLWCICSFTRTCRRRVDVETCCSSNGALVDVELYF